MECRVDLGQDVGYINTQLGGGQPGALVPTLKQAGYRNSRLLKKPLVRKLIQASPLSMDSFHGPVHWARVAENGRRLAPITGGVLEVIDLFSVLHDSQRLHDGRDRDHGERAAKYVTTHKREFSHLTYHQIDQLAYACEFHSKGLTEADVTIQTCWDADRLDLGRVGIMPHVKYLCTDAAKQTETLEWANKRAIHGEKPIDILREWGC